MSPVSAASRTEWSRRLARALVSGGYVTDDVLAPLLAESSQAGMPLARLLIARGVVTPPVAVNTLAQLARLPVIDLQAEPPAPEVANLIPALLATDHQAVAVRVVGSQAVVAFAEPPEPADVKSLGDLVGFEVVPVLADPVVIGSLIGPGGGGTSPATGATAGAGNGAGAPGTGSHGEHGGGSRPQGTPSAGSSRAQGVTDTPLHVDDLLRYAVSIGASDLHLTANMPPTVRLHGALRPMEDVDPIDNNTLRDMIFGILPQTQRERFEAEHELDTSHTIAGVGRFRVNVCLQRGSIAVALRPIPHEIPEFDTLGLPSAIRSFTELRRGLVLVTGPTGSGKSTSLASLIDIINRSKPLHIVTVEDPIEFLHGHKRSVISQREVGADTASFSEALRRVLRQDPDVILVGELRDLETIATALTAAETGHLVFATLHTQDAPSTIDRIIDVFPPNQQDQIRIQLGSSLQGVVTQQLVPTASGDGRCVAAEVLVCTTAIQNLIRGAKTHQIYSLMQTGGQYGMQTMDQSLATLVHQQVITQGVAIDRCRSEEDFRNHLRGV
ncbi:MAG: PilT/PilU family type 4a pilus ATPase [Actinomycetota bacterium]|jgi:twitching motility protein PilT|nr:PilT/PilU family type 4a pilus ATPase [Actinomycetota bacterium]